MMILLRRFVVLVALSFWQGGFTFYAAVVVPVGQQVFGHLRQGFITQQVTFYMNLAGAVALLLLVWDLLGAQDAARWRRTMRWLLWGGMTAALLWLYWLHGQMDALLVFKGRIIRDAESFRTLHRLYLWISTVQWGCGLLYLVVTMVVWSREDRGSKKSESFVG